MLAVAPGVVAGELVGEAVAAREGAGEDDAGVVAHRLGQHPAFGQVLTGAGALVGLHQGDARLAQGVEASRQSQLRGDVQRLDQLRRHAVLLGQVERAGAAGQLDHVGRVADGFEAAAAVLALHHAGDLLVDDQVAEALRDEIDELLAAQNAQGVVGVHDRLVGAGQAQPRAADDNGTKGRLVAVVGAPRGSLAVGLESLGQRLGQRVQRRRGGCLRTVVHIGLTRGNGGSGCH